MSLRSKLIKPRYDEDELRKAIDTVVDELVPRDPELNFDLVPRPEYDRVVNLNDELTNDIADLERDIDQANVQITNLESENEQLEIQNDQAQTSVSIAENQVQALQDQFQQLNIDFREALQKSIQEGVDKVSLQAQNDGLRAELNALISDLNSSRSQIQSLEQRLEGRDAEVAQGADLVGDLTVLNLQQNEAQQADFRFETDEGKADRSQGNWTKGKEWRITNTGETPMTVDIDFTNDWMEPDTKTIRLEPQEDHIVTFTLNWGNIKGRRPTKVYHTRSKKYYGDLSFRVRETGQASSFNGLLRKYT